MISNGIYATNISTGQIEPEHLRNGSMPKFPLICALFIIAGCTSIHSPYDLHDWCQIMGSTRLASLGPGAQDPANCDAELEEDLADRTPRILYIPKDVVMSPVIAARAVWVFLGMTRPPF